MPVNGVGGTPTYAPQSVTGYTGTTSMKDFFGLIVNQLKYQDPMNPQSQSEFIGQMASIEALAKMEEMAATTASLLSISQLGQASSLIGKQVSALGGETGTIEGTVEKVVASEGKVSLVVNGTKVDIASVKEVA